MTAPKICLTIPNALDPTPIDLERDLMEDDEPTTLARGLRRAMLVFDPCSDDSIHSPHDQVDSPERDDHQEGTHGIRLSSTSSTSSLLSESGSIASIPENQLKVKFDVVRTRIVDDKKHKYVLYMVIVMEVPRFDTDQTIIERRYSDFLTLHKGLKRECPSAVRGLPFPKKALFGKNFENEVLERRSRQFEKYLRYIYHQDGVVQTKAFREFFFLPHLRSATMRLRCEECADSYEQFRIACQLQRKLGDSQKELLRSMCCLIEVCRSMKKYEEGDRLASDALDKLQYDISCSYLLPLINATLEIRKKLSRDTSWLKSKLLECERLSGGSRDMEVTLRELAVRWY